jgi:2-(1,2-epoxy-1,2-dihydrophenyl)acetyl-CoA isomerase
MSDTVTRDDADGVATLTLQRPALSHALRTELLAAVEGVAADESVRAVLLTGTGRAFCVGQDLAEHLESLRGNAATSLNVVVEEYNPLMLALAGLRVPVVVGINGACAGAGLGLALAGDLRIAAAGVKFTTAFTGVGLSSDSALASRLVHCVGGSRAAQLLLTPDPFTSETAEQWGLVHRVVPAEQVLPEAQALAARLAAGPTAAYRAVKTVLATAATDSLEETLALEARLQAELGRTADHREAVEAFLAKRAPEFTGR